jgi:hypothetical protein
MSRVRRRKKKTKPSAAEAESDSAPEATPEDDESTLGDDLDAIESILDKLESPASTVEVEPAPPEVDEPSQKPLSEEAILAATVKSPAPPKLKKPYRFPKVPQPVVAQPSSRSIPKKLRRTPKVRESPPVEPAPHSTSQSKQVDRLQLSKKELERILNHEGELYASVATLDFLTTEFTEHGTISPDQYRRYLRSFLNNVEKAQKSLERQGIGVFDFVAQEGLAQQFPKGTEILEKHLKGVLVVPSYDITQLPRKSAKFVSTCIELIDLLRLGELARVELLLPLLDDLARVLESISFIGCEYWSVKEIHEWVKTLEPERPETILNENLASMLELQADRWLRDFKDQLSKL